MCVYLSFVWASWFIKTSYNMPAQNPASLRVCCHGIWATSGCVLAKRCGLPMHRGKYFLPYPYPPRPQCKCIEINCLISGPWNKDPGSWIQHPASRILNQDTGSSIQKLNCLLNSLFNNLLLTGVGVGWKYLHELHAPNGLITKCSD